MILLFIQGVITSKKTTPRLTKNYNINDIKEGTDALWLKPDLIDLEDKTEEFYKWDDHRLSDDDLEKVVVFFWVWRPVPWEF